MRKAEELRLGSGGIKLEDLDEAQTAAGAPDGHGEAVDGNVLVRERVGVLSFGSRRVGSVGPEWQQGEAQAQEVLRDEGCRDEATGSRSPSRTSTARFPWKKMRRKRRRGTLSPRASLGVSLMASCRPRRTGGQLGCSVLGQVRQRRMGFMDPGRDHP